MQYKLRTLNGNIASNIALETYLVQTVGRILSEKQVENEGAVCRRRRHTRWRTGDDVGTRNNQKNEPSEQRRRKQSSEEAVEVMPKTIERTLS